MLSRTLARTIHCGIVVAALMAASAPGFASAYTAKRDHAGGVAGSSDLGGFTPTFQSAHYLPYFVGGDTGSNVTGIGGNYVFDTVSVNCPYQFSKGGGCLLIMEIEAEVGDAPNGAQPYDWAIIPRVDGNSPIGFGVQGLIRTDSQNNNGWVTGNTHLVTLIGPGIHTLTSEVYLPYNNMSLPQWQVVYTVLTRTTN